MATARPTGNLVDTLERHAKDIRRLKAKLPSLVESSGGSFLRADGTVDLTGDQKFEGFLNAWNTVDGVQAGSVSGYEAAGRETLVLEGGDGDQTDSRIHIMGAGDSKPNNIDINTATMRVWDLAGPTRWIEIDLASNLHSTFGKGAPEDDKMAVWFSDPSSGGGLWFDTDGKKRMTWNDGSGNWLFMANMYHDAASGDVHLSSEGPAQMRWMTDSADPYIQIRLADGTGHVDGDAITWDATYQFNRDSVLLDKEIHLGDANTVLDKNNGTDDQLRVTTPSGYIDIGPRNSSWAHIETDISTGFYFNNRLNVNGDFRGYTNSKFMPDRNDTDTYMDSGGANALRFSLGGDTLAFEPASIHGSITGGNGMILRTLSNPSGGDAEIFQVRSSGEAVRLHVAHSDWVSGGAATGDPGFTNSGAGEIGWKDTGEYMDRNGNEIVFNTNSTRRFGMQFASNGSQLRGNAGGDWFEIDSTNNLFQWYLSNEEEMRVQDGGSNSYLLLRDGLTDVGNHETLRLNRGTGGALREVGYYSSRVTDPETGKVLKANVTRATDALGLQDTIGPGTLDLNWIDSVDPIFYQRTQTLEALASEDGVSGWELGFDLEELSQASPYLTTKPGETVGYSPDEMAIIALLWTGLKDARKRITELEAQL